MRWRRHSWDCTTQFRRDVLLFRLNPVAGALARGDAAINLRFPHKGYREKIWDHVAGVLIVEEAGARISDASGDSTYTKSNTAS